MVAIRLGDATALSAASGEYSLLRLSVTTSSRRSGPNDRVLEDEMATV
jgi:hypothetical protein